jgi:TcdA/TcdB catalytic glycosyltransferase domain
MINTSYSTIPVQKFSKTVASQFPLSPTTPFDYDRSHFYDENLARLSLDERQVYLARYIYNILPGTPLSERHTLWNVLKLFSCLFNQFNESEADSKYKKYLLSSLQLYSPSIMAFFEKLAYHINLNLCVTVEAIKLFKAMKTCCLFGENTAKDCISITREAEFIMNTIRLSRLDPITPIEAHRILINLSSYFIKSTDENKKKLLLQARSTDTNPCFFQAISENIEGNKNLTDCDSFIKKMKIDSFKLMKIESVKNAKSVSIVNGGNTVPSIVHFVWLGGPISKESIDNINVFHKFNKDYEIYLHTDNVRKIFVEIERLNIDYPGRYNNLLNCIKVVHYKKSFQPINYLESIDLDIINDEGSQPLINAIKIEDDINSKKLNNLIKAVRLESGFLNKETFLNKDNYINTNYGLSSP